MRVTAASLLLATLASAWIPCASAVGTIPVPGDPTPNAPNAIDVVLRLDLAPDLSSFRVSTDLAIHEAEVANGQGMPAQALRDGGPDVRAAFEERARHALVAQLSQVFMDAPPTNLHVSFMYGESDLDADPYDPPILAFAGADVPLTPSLFGVNGIRFVGGPDLARGFLYSGGVVTLERNVEVPAGYAMRITVGVPEFLRLDGARSRNTTALAFAHSNLQGATAEPLPLRFTLALRPEAVPANVREGPIVRATFAADDDTPLWLKAVPFTRGRYSAQLDLWIEVPSLSTSYFEETPLPPNLRTPRYSADLLRAAVRERLVPERELAGFFTDVISRGLAEGFGEDVVVHVDDAALHASLARPIGGADGRHVDPLLIHAAALLPLRSDKMMAGSGLAQTLGTFTGIPASFPLANEGSWRLELTLLYPEGAQVKAHDTLGRAHAFTSGRREGFQVTLAPGESTRMRVDGRPPLDPWVLAIGFAEAVSGLLAAFLGTRTLVRRVARARRRRKMPA